MKRIPTRAATLSLPALLFCEAALAAPLSDAELHMAGGGLIALLAFTLIAAIFISRHRLSRAHEERARLQRILDTLPAGVGEFDFDGMTLVGGYLNPGYYELFGMSPGEGRRLVPTDFLDAIHVDDIKPFYEELRRSEGTDTDFRQDVRLRARGGAYRWISLRGRVTKCEGEKVSYLFTFHDEDAAHRMRSALHESETRLSAAIAHSGMHVWVISPERSEARVLSSPNALSEDEPTVIEGYPDSFISAGFVHEDDVDRFTDAVRRAMAGEELSPMMIRIMQHKEWHYKQVSHTPIKDECGRILSVLGTAVEMEKYGYLDRWMNITLRQTGVIVLVYYPGEKRITVGYDKDERIYEDAPRSIVEAGFIHPDDIAEHAALYREMDEGLETVSRTLRMRKAKGAEFSHIKVVGTLVDGPPCRRYIMTAVDVTRAAMAERLYENELSYRHSLDLDVLWASTVDVTADRVINRLQNGVIVDVMEEGAGYSCRIRERIGSIYDDTEEAEIRYMLRPSGLRQAFEAGRRSLSMEYQRVMPDGSRRWVDCRVNLLEAPGTGNILAFLYGKDINNRKMDDLTLDAVVSSRTDFICRIDVRRGEAHFVRKTEIVDLMTGGMPDTFSYDSHAPEFLALYEPDADDAESLSILEGAATVEGLAAMIEERGELRLAALVTEPAEKRRKYIRLFFLDAAKDTIVAAQFDVTERYLEEERRATELRESLDAAKAASEAKSGFLSRMSHEIRTPMNAIIGLTNLSRSHIDDAIYVKENLAKIDTSAHYLLEIINSILDISRIESGKMELDEKPGSLRALIDEIDVIIRPRAEEGEVLLVRNISHELPASCVFDALKLKQVLVNLLANAVKFTPAGGTVRFSAEVLSDGPDEAMLRFTVSDTGVGIAKEFLPRLFEPFEQESAGSTTRYGGTGLGLAISRSIVDLMGGIITVDSDKGKGTTFTVTAGFRLSESEPGTIGAADTFADFTDMHVLIAEDNEINLEIATTIVADRGALVTSATDGEKAVSAFLASPVGYFDLIFMDIRMPFMDGMEAARMIRAAYREDAKSVQIIAMSANAFAEDRRRAREAGMNGYLTKPVEPAQIYVALAKARQLRGAPQDATPSREEDAIDSLASQKSGAAHSRGEDDGTGA